MLSFLFKHYSHAQILPDDGTFTVRSQTIVVHAKSKSLESAVTFQRQLDYLALKIFGGFLKLTLPVSDVR